MLMISKLLEIVKNVKHPENIGEGNIDTPSKAKGHGISCYSVVVGSIVTRPQLITKKFVDEISDKGGKRYDG